MLVLLIFLKLKLLKYNRFTVCVNLCCTAKWLSYIYTWIYRILFHVLFHYGLSQEAEYSSLCRTAGPCCFSFCILCTNLHLLILNAHCIPPLPSILLGNHGSLSVSLFLIQRWVPRGSGAARRLSFSAWLPSLGVSPLGPSCSRSAPAALVAVPQPPTAADAEVRHWLPWARSVVAPPAVLTLTRSPAAGTSGVVCPHDVLGRLCLYSCFLPEASMLSCPWKYRCCKLWFLLPFCWKRKMFDSLTL